MCLFSIIMDALSLAARAILMQADKNSDLHSCIYYSHTFTSAQWIYNTYNHELLAVILALEEWHQYLQGTTHPFIITTNHKNLRTLKCCLDNRPDGHYFSRILTCNGRSLQVPRWVQQTHSLDGIMYISLRTMWRLVISSPVVDWKKTVNQTEPTMVATGLKLPVHTFYKVNGLGCLKWSNKLKTWLQPVTTGL